jgi:ABC-type uncharacterized transport system substrate-binding protein
VNHLFSIKVLGLCALYVLCAIGCLTATIDSHAAESTTPKRVLMISTGSRLAPGFALVEQTTLDVLRQLRSGETEFYSESLDIVRFPSESYHRIFRNYLIEKYTDYPPSLVFLIYVGNLNVAKKLLYNLFPDAPVVVAGFTEEQISFGELGPHVTGLAQRVDPHGTIELILRLQPEKRRIVVIGGTAEVDVHVIERARKAASAFSDRVEFDFWTNRSMIQISDAVKSLPPQTAVLFTRMFRDSTGRAFNSGPAAQSIAQLSSALVYIMADSMFGTGAVGGSVADVSSMGKQAGEIAHRILNGVEPGSFPLKIIDSGVPTFDWRALKRWSIH